MPKNVYQIVHELILKQDKLIGWSDRGYVKIFDFHKLFETHRIEYFPNCKPESFKTRLSKYFKCSWTKNGAETESSFNIP